jgi:VanZ family protein
MHQKGGKTHPAPKRRLLRRLSIALGVWMLIIFISSSLPASFFPEVDSIIYAKMVHLFYYAVLGGLVWRLGGAQHRWRWLHKHAALAGILVSILYGATDELHQRFTVGRHPMMADVLIDGVGATLFVAGVSIVGMLKKGATMRRVNEFCPYCVPAGRLLQVYQRTTAQRLIRLFFPVDRVRCDRCGREDWAWMRGDGISRSAEFPPGLLLLFFIILVVVAIIVRP